MRTASGVSRKAPIFIFADDDRGAADRILERLHPEWYYVTVTRPRELPRYARRFDPAAIFLADPVEYPNGGTAALLQALIDQVGKPVIILCESWSPELSQKWKCQGAEDCLPHPTRFGERFDLLRTKMQKLAMGGRRKRTGISSQEGDR